MDSRLKEVFDSYLKADKQELADVGRQAFANIVGRYAEATNDKETAFAFGMACLSTFIVQDNEMAGSEWALIEYIFQQEMSQDEAFNIIKAAFDKEYYAQIKDIAEKDEYMKQNICRLGLAVCAIDGSISEDEEAWLAFLISK